MTEQIKSIDSKLNSILSGIKESELEESKYLSRETIMTDAQIELIDKVCEPIFNYCKSHRQVYIDRKVKSYLTYIGKQWDMNQPTFKTIPVTNIIWGIIEYEVPLMTENRPIIKAAAGNPVDIPYAEGINKGLEYVWDSNEMTFRLPFWMRDVLVIGDTFGKIYWDYNIEEIVIDDVEADYFYPEPYVSDVKKMKYVIHAEPRPLHDIVTMYPNGKYVKSENVHSPMAEAVAEEGDTTLYETRESLDAEGVYTSKEGKSVSYRALIKELWIDDKTTTIKSKPVLDEYGMQSYEMVEAGEYKKDKDGNFIPQVIHYQERKYPYGRIIHWANGILLADFVCPYEHGKPPYVHFKNVKMKRSFWSYEDPYQLIAIQTQLNKRKAQIDFIADQTGNSVWVVDVDSGVKRSQITNQPGLIVYKRTGSEVNRLSPPPIPEYLFRNIDDLKFEANFVSGLHSVVTGDKPGSITAGSAIAELIERALVRVKEKTKYMEASIVDLGRLAMSYMRQFWIEPRQFPVFSSMSGGVNKVVEFSGKSLSFDPKIRVIAGSTMTTSKTSKFEQGVVMLRLGIIDRQEFLEYIEYPNAEDVLVRLQQQEEQMQQMQRESEDKEFQAKMQGYLTKLKAAQINKSAKLETQVLANRGAMEEQVFNFNDLLTRPYWTGEGSNITRPTGQGVM